MGNDIPQEIKQVYIIYSKSLCNRKKVSKYSTRFCNNIFKQLFQSFTRFHQYQWSQQIIQLFGSYFKENIGGLWEEDRETFYRQIMENGGLIQSERKNKIDYESQFYNREDIKKKEEQSNILNIEEKIYALNSSIMEEQSIVPIIMPKKKVKSGNNGNNKVYTSLTERKRVDSQYQYYTQTQQRQNQSQYYDMQILRSSVLVPETVFVQRLNDNSKKEINNMLNFYKVFSESLQQIIKSLNLITCPLKHFEIYIKRRLKIKNIKHSQSSKSLINSTSRNSHIQRKVKQHNNHQLLDQIRDFTEAYTQFVWKYLDLYRLSETSVGTFITTDTVYGIILRQVWTFTFWIGDRGYQWEEKLIPSILNKIHLQNAILIEESEKKKKNKKEKENKQNIIKVDEEIIGMSCELRFQNNPQKYLKKIVMIYRELSRKCGNADELILYYEALFQQIAKRNCCQRLLKMQTIIQKLLKIQDSSGQICYAWTTWNLMIETIKRGISAEPQQVLAEEDFKNYLKKAQQKRRKNL